MPCNPEIYIKLPALNCLHYHKCVFNQTELEQGHCIITAGGKEEGKLGGGGRKGSWMEGEGREVGGGRRKGGGDLLFLLKKLSHELVSTSINNTMFLAHIKGTKHISSDPQSKDRSARFTTVLFKPLIDHRVQESTMWFSLKCPNCRTNGVYVSTPCELNIPKIFFQYGFPTWFSKISK